MTAEWPEGLTAETRQLLTNMAQMGNPPLHEMPVDAGRMLYETLVQAIDMPAVDMAQVADLTISGPGGDVPVRVYTPHTGQAGARPAVVYFHGGGFVIGNIATHDRTCRYLADKAGAVVASVDYRLAPEHPFPAGLDDCNAATAWFAGAAADYGGDAGALFVAGDSAGGNLAAVVALDARGAGPALAGQVLLYPTTTAAEETASLKELGGKGLFLEKQGMDWFQRHYLGADGDRTDPRVSPLRADDLTGLPPAYVMTAEFDPLRDEGRAYADKLAAAGVPVTYRQWDGLVHGFLGMGAMIPQARHAIDETADWIGQVAKAN